MVRKLKRMPKYDYLANLDETKIGRHSRKDYARLIFPEGAFRSGWYVISLAVMNDEKWSIVKKFLLQFEEGRIPVFFRCKKSHLSI